MAEPIAAVPTLFIDYRIELSGSVLNAKPRGIFFGAGMFFDTAFVLPGSDTRLELYVKTWRSPTRNVMRLKNRTAGDVYEDLARRSFNLFLRRYLDRIFQAPPAAVLPPLALPDQDADDKDKEADEPDDKDDQAG